MSDIEIFQSLELSPLSEALTKLEQYARLQEKVTTAQWAMLELEGYLGKYAYTCPDYRTVILSYFDASGQAIPELSKDYGSWALLHGVTKLEAHLKNGMTLKLSSEVENFLSQASSKQVYGGHVEPEQIKAVLGSVRTEAKSKLQSM